MAQLLLLAVRMLKQLNWAEGTDLVGAYTLMNYVVVEPLEDSLPSIGEDDPMLSAGIGEIEDLIYRIEDEFEKYGVLSRSRSWCPTQLWHISADFRRMYSNILSSGQGSADKKIRDLCAQISRIISLGVLYRHHPDTNLDRKGRLKQLAYNYDDEGAVGLEEEKTLILELLLAGLEGGSCSGYSFNAIPIWGVSGTGKTTLAHAIYNDPRIVNEFGKNRIKIHVAENFDINYALLLVLGTIQGYDVKEYRGFPAEDLARLTRQHLEKSSRSLILLDDIRSIEDWGILRMAVGAKGCRILVTTRTREVAEHIIQAPYIHKKRLLTEENSWKLLERTGVEIKSFKEKVGGELVKQCEGLPGAIVALSKLLAGKDESQWEIVQKNAQSYLSQVMSPNYAELSDHLKLCFLYLGHFRDDPKIELEKLSHLWTIEGLVSSNECGRTMSLFDLTQEILMALAHRGMIELEQLVVEVKSCRLVGLMGYMCLSKAEERNLLKVIDLRSADHQPSFHFGTARRVVIYLGKYSPRVTPETTRNLRSLRIIGADEHQQLEELVLPSIMLELEKFKALRILDFDSIDFRGIDNGKASSKLPVGIFALSLLRYLSFKGCFLEELPSSILNLSCLQVLDLRINDSCKMIIPLSLQRMERLRHLYLPPAFQMSNGKRLQLDGLRELQTLKNFSKVCEIGDLFKLENLQYLHAKVEGSYEDLESIANHMRTRPEKWLLSAIEIKNFDCYTEKRHNLFRQLLALGVPPKLSFEGRIDHLPRYSLISQRITEMVLSSSQLKEDPMTTLEKLTKLRRLVLSDDAFIGTEMVCPALGFPELKHLELSSLFLLEKWTVEDKSMPRLSLLKIKNCQKLLLPDGLEYLSALQEIMTGKMPKPFKESLHERYGKQGVGQVKQPPSLVHDNWL